ncbi:hypothetical protein H7J07_19360 [Mycobacterium koreense]|nr:hypothetical protein [Mycolicibacillus koreensis]
MADTAAAGPVAAGSVARVGVATALSALCGYAVMALAASDLDPAGFSVFAVFWGAFGLINGAANGLLQEATREVRAAPAVSASTGARTRPLTVAAGCAVVAAIGALATSPVWSGRVFAEQRVLSVGLLAAGLAGFCLHATVLGMLAGRNRWGAYGALMVTDAATRVLVAVAAFVIGWGLAGYLWATVAGSTAWLVLLVVSPGSREAARQATPGTTASFLRGAAHSITAAGASAVLVMGFPVLLKATAGELGAQGGVIILAVTLTRAPLLVPLTALQGNLIAHFVDERARRLRTLGTAVAVVAAIGAVGVAAAATVGPWLLVTAFGADYHAGGAALAWLTVAAIGIATLTLTGNAAVAAALHRAYALGWVSATVATTGVLLLPLDLQTRTVAGLLCGAAVGIAVHLMALRRADRLR